MLPWQGCATQLVACSLCGRRFDGLVLSGQTVGSGLLEQGSRLVTLVKKKACESGRVASV